MTLLLSFEVLGHQNGDDSVGLDVLGCRADVGDEVMLNVLRCQLTY